MDKTPAKTKVATKRKERRLGMNKQQRNFPTKTSLRKMGHRGGAVRFSEDFYEASKDYMSEYMTKLIERISVITAHGKKKTVSVDDVLLALSEEGRDMLGYGPVAT